MPFSGFRKLALQAIEGLLGCKAQARAREGCQIIGFSTEV